MFVSLWLTHLTWPRALKFHPCHRRWRDFRSSVTGQCATTCAQKPRPFHPPVCPWRPRLPPCPGHREQHCSIHGVAAIPWDRDSVSLRHMSRGKPLDHMAAHPYFSTRFSVVGAPTPIPTGCAQGLPHVLTSSCHLPVMMTAILPGVKGHLTIGLIISLISRDAELPSVHLWVTWISSLEKYPSVLQDVCELVHTRILC